MADLESEMKLLRWHKLANESALKAAIIKNKSMKRKEKSMLRLPFDINAHLNTVIQEEHSKDLVANEEFVQRYLEVEKKDEANERRRLTVNQTRLHSIQKKLEDLDENRSRKVKCSSIRNLMEVGHEQTGRVDDALYSNPDIEEDDNDDETVRMHEQKNSIHSRMSAMSERFSRPSTVERTKIHFSKHRPKSHGSEPTGIVYCKNDMIEMPTST